MINYDKSFNARINKAVRAFNAKVRRLEKSGHKYLPDIVSVADLKSTYFERDELKRKIGQLENFISKGAEEIVELEQGAKITKWELGVMRSDMSYLKRRYGRQMEYYGNIVPTVMGKVQATNYARMGDPRYENLKILKESMEKDLDNVDQSILNKIKSKVKAQMRRFNRQKYVLWANYFTFLEDVAYKAGIDAELLESVKDKLSRMDIDEFIKFFDTEKAFSAIIDYYDIQKLKAGGYSNTETQTVKELFESINQIADEYLK